MGASGLLPMNPTAAEVPGTVRLAHFEFSPKRDRLGEGPQCEVFRAKDTRLDRTVALKILRPHVEFDPSAAQRFEREARHTSSLAHPNIATVFEYGRENSTSFIAMEFLEGRTLEQIVKDRTLGFAEGVRIAMQVTSALDLVHRHGLIHRDLKPGNVMLLEDGSVKLLDFGICRSREEPTITQDGMLVGTVLYMSPEQVQGDDLSASSDVFALGAVLYHALTGELPFPGRSFPEVCMAILAGNPERPSIVRTGFPALLEEFVLRCLAPRPMDRYQDAAAAHGALMAVADSLHMNNGGVKESTTLRGRVLIPPIESETETEHASLIAMSLRRDLESELSRSTSLEIELLPDRSLPADSRGAFVLHATLEVGENRGVLNCVLGRAIGGDDVTALSCETIEHTDNDEWGLQGQLVGSAARAIRRRLGEFALEPIQERPRQPEKARALAVHAHQVLHCATSKKLMSAVSTFRRAIDADPTCALAHAGMAEALVHKFLYFDGDRTFIDEAMQSARRALTIDPGCAEAHTSLGFAYATTGHTADAQREYRLAIQHDNEEFLAHRLLGALYAREGNFKAASPLLRRAIALRQTHIGSYDHLYTVLRHLDRYEEALEVADQGIAIARDRLAQVPADQEARTHCALLLGRIGLTKEARAEAQRALNIAPKDGYTLYYCACVHAVIGDSVQALALLKQAQDRGYHIQSELARNADLDPLRGTPQFQSLMS